VQRFHENSSLTSIPHLTCRGRTREEVRALLERYHADGVKGILALAGDPIEDGEPPGDYGYAADLVREIQSFNGEIADPARRFRVGVAGFPEGHPDTPNRLQEMAHLKAKVDEGADWICTQLFFDNRDYYDYRERCELEGIDVPILAGIMPVTSWKAYEKMAELAGGVRYPAALIRSLRRCEDAESVARVGVHWATEQCRDLLDHQVDGLHFYTLNRSRATLEIYRSLGVKTSRSLAASA
jgi:methylenetetrahydrofolate reductase (NADPH)